MQMNTTGAMHPPVRKRVYIAYTGGTIGMQPTSQGYAPAPGWLEAQMRALPELAHPSMPEYTIHEYEPLLDSSSMTPSDWVHIAEDIAANYDAYDGFIVLHGTDTMAYTASALPFLLQGLAKPVILTGSQIPLGEVRNDARANLISALYIAAAYPLPEVCVYFGSQLLRGCRTTKVSADDLEAFASPNFPALGEAGVEIEIHWNLVRQPLHRRGVRVPPLELSATVGALRLFPGISAQALRNLLQPPIQGLVLEAYGAGNAPDQDAELIAAIRDACQRGVVIIAVTQCLRGMVHLGAYAAGSALQHAGVVSGFDMTAEAALSKLFFLLSAGYAPERVRALLQQDLCGELTPDSGQRLGL